MSSLTETEIMQAKYAEICAGMEAFISSVKDTDEAVYSGKEVKEIFASIRDLTDYLIGDLMPKYHLAMEKLAALENGGKDLERDARFKDLYASLCQEYSEENTNLYTAIAPLLGLKPFYGTCNKEQVIWAFSQEEANELPAGANIFTFIRLAMRDQATTPGAI